MVVGVNVYDEGFLSPPEQDAEIERLAKNGVKTSGYNGDIPMPGTGRALGLADLNNPKDPEGPAIAIGFRNYLHILEALKDVRDHSKLNKTTPILLPGLADWGLPSAKAWDAKAGVSLGVSLPDTIEFLRQNGLEKLVDGYGAHVYPTGDPHATVPARMAELDKKKIFSECSRDKPCWLTEWGIPNGQSCPIDDANRTQVIEAERKAFEPLVQQGRLGPQSSTTPGVARPPQSIRWAFSDVGFLPAQAERR